VTLLAVVDIAAGETGGDICDKSIGEGTGGTSSAAAEAASADEPLFLPKLSFHFDGFLVTGFGTTGVVVAAGVIVAGGGEMRAGGDLADVEVERVLDSKAVGIAYIDTGSNGTLARLELAVVLVEVERTEAPVEGALDGDLLAMLISLASDATASVSRVTSWGTGMGLAAEVKPLPLRAPLFRLLFVDVERDVMPSISTSSCSCSSTSSSLS